MPSTSGNVIIGKPTSGLYKIQFSGESAERKGFIYFEGASSISLPSILKFESSNTFTGGTVGSGAEMAFYTTSRTSANAIEALRIDHVGNVGIGTISPNARLSIYNPGSFNSHMTANGQDHLLFRSNDPGIGGYFGGVTWESGQRRRASIVASREHSDADYVGLAFFTKGVDGDGAHC